MVQRAKNADENKATVLLPRVVATIQEKIQVKISSFEIFQRTANFVIPPKCSQRAEKIRHDSTH